MAADLDAAKVGLRREHGGDSPEAEALDDAADEGQVHAADQLGVLGREPIERFTVAHQAMLAVGILEIWGALVRLATSHGRGSTLSQEVR